MKKLLVISIIFLLILNITVFAHTPEQIQYPIDIMLQDHPEITNYIVTSDNLDNWYYYYYIGDIPVSTWITGYDRYTLPYADYTNGSDSDGSYNPNRHGGGQISGPYGYIHYATQDVKRINKDTLVEEIAFFANVTPIPTPTVNPPQPPHLYPGVTGEIIGGILSPIPGLVKLLLPYMILILAFWMAWRVLQSLLHRA